jgi:hypothetical protein
VKVLVTGCLLLLENIYPMKLAAYMAVSFITFFHILLVLFCIIVYMVVCFVCFCLILYIMYSYFYVCTVLGILLH